MKEEGLGGSGPRQPVRGKRAPLEFPDDRTVRPGDRTGKSVVLGLHMTRCPVALPPLPLRGPPPPPPPLGSLYLSWAYACLLVIPGPHAGQCCAPGLPPWGCPFLVLPATHAALWRSARDGGREPMHEVTQPPSCLRSTSPRSRAGPPPNLAPTVSAFLPAMGLRGVARVTGGKPTEMGAGFPRAGPAHSVHEVRAQQPKNWRNSPKAAGRVRTRSSVCWH